MPRGKDREPRGRLTKDEAPFFISMLKDPTVMDLSHAEATDFAQNAGFPYATQHMVENWRRQLRRGMSE